MGQQNPLQTTNDAVIPHWNDPESEQMSIVSGEDATVYDESGKAHLDFVSQLYCCNAGHSNEAIMSAVTEQMERIPYVASAKHNDTRSKLAADITEIAPDNLSEVFFSISGSEANETAIQIAREIQDGGKILTRWQSYHGGTYASGGLTGDPSTRNSLERHAATTRTEKFLPPLPKCFDGAEGEELARKAAEHLEYVIINEGKDEVAAILTEPIGGSSGAFPAPEGYFERVREICDKHDVLLIVDEVITGFGRTGEWFGIQTEDVQPDILSFAKGVTSAYVPLAGVVVSESIGEAMHNMTYDLGQTFAGHPTACAAGRAAIKEYRDGLLENAREMGPHLERRLRDLERDHDVVSDVRGRGLHWSVVFGDPETGEPIVHPWIDEDAENPVSDVLGIAQDNGVIFGGGRPKTQLLVTPPLCVTEAEIDEAIDTLEEAIVDVFY